MNFDTSLCRPLASPSHHPPSSKSRGLTHLSPHKPALIHAPSNAGEQTDGGKEGSRNLETSRTTESVHIPSSASSCSVPVPWSCGCDPFCPLDSRCWVVFLPVFLRRSRTLPLNAKKLRRTRERDFKFIVWTENVQAF